VRRFSLGLLAATALLIAVPSGASAGTQIGATSAPNSFCDAPFTRLQTTTSLYAYVTPSDGVITRWSFRADGSPPQLKFKVGRLAGLPGSTTFTVIGQSGLVTPVASTLNSYFIRIPVQAGDIIGSFTMTSGNCATAAVSNYRRTSGDVMPGNTANFNELITDAQLDISAVLESDCDRDGLGDETQDRNLPTPPCPKPLTCKGKRLTIVGSNGPDEIIGTARRDVIGALDGNDRVRGLDGKDLICGGKNKDTLKGGKGNDKLLGQKGRDKLKGGGGRDKLNGGGGRDFCKGGKGPKGGDSASACEVEKSI
jgi:Ca2+-binding RTX toxin-like protein